MRNIYNTLKLWKNSEKRKPLLIRGVRQVGKTYLMQDFAKQEYKAFLYLNFEKDKTLDSLFKDNLDPRKIIENLEIFFNTKINIHEDLLIFDEVQESPSALNSLKYFSESEKSYHVLAAGSLLGVKLNQQGFPVGKVNFVDLYPLTFLEFLAAINETKLFDYLNNLTNQQTPAEAIHLKLLDIFKTYLLIGGMPEVVYNYAANKNWQAAREIQENILEAYQLDFAKHAPKDQVIRIREIFDIIPSQLAKENRKFFFNAISNSARAREYSLALTWLKDAHLIMQSHNIEIVDLPLKAHAAHNIFKVYFFDVGLLGALLKTPITLLLNPEKLFESFHGALIENFVAQEFIAYKLGPLYYWTSAGQAEVDFILQHDLSTIPVEVKAGSSKRKKSLKIFAEKYSPEHLFRISTMNLKKENHLFNYPLYGIHLIKDYLSKTFS